MSRTRIAEAQLAPTHSANTGRVDEVDPLADIIRGTSTRCLGERIPGGLRTPLWRLITTSDFGTRVHPVLHTRRFHRGIDFGARAGTNVRAAAGGTVVWANDLGPYGNLIVIQHAADLHTAYGHLEAITVATGEQVRAGHRIGRVGSTGLATGPHLHFEVRSNGTPTKPTQWIDQPLGVVCATVDALTARLRGSDENPARRSLSRRSGIPL